MQDNQMNQTASTLASSDIDEITLKDLSKKVKAFFRFIFSKWKLLLVFITIGAIIGFITARNSKATFIATTTFVLEEQGGGGVNQFAGIASMVGMDLSGGSGGGIFQGDNLLELYKSRLMLEKTLLTKVFVQGNSTTLLEYYFKINNVRETWSKEKKFKNLNFNIESGKPHTRIQDSLITLTVKDIDKNYLTVNKPDKKLSIIKVEVRSENELFSKLFNDAIVRNVNQFYINTKTEKSVTNINIIQHQADSIRASLNGAIYSIASTIDLNPNLNYARQKLKVPGQKKQIDVDANKAILTELVKNLESSKYLLRKETPLIQVIDVPVLPLEKTKLSTAKGMFLGGLIAAFFCLAVISFKVFNDYLKS